MRYETEGMAKLRELLAAEKFTHAEIDTFKYCLIKLERQGFRLTKEPIILGDS